MKEITSLTVGGQSYAITDPNKLPQPENPVVGNFLAVEAVEDGKVSRVGSAPQVIFLDVTGSTKPGTQTFRHNYNISELYAWIQMGKTVICRVSKRLLPYVEMIWDETETEDGIAQLVFRATGTGSSSIVTLDHSGAGWLTNVETVNVDASLRFEGWAADAKAVGEKFGDISAALDHILALQEELIG